MKNPIIRVPLDDLHLAAGQLAVEIDGYKDDRIHDQGDREEEPLQYIEMHIDNLVDVGVAIVFQLQRIADELEKRGKDRA
jgi:hypothetical protein